MVYLPIVDLFRLPRYSRLHRLQEAHFQLGRKDQQAVVSTTRCLWPLSDPESARLLWILQSLRVGHCLPDMLCEKYSSRLQGSLHEVRAGHLAEMVHRRLCSGPVSSLRHGLGSPLFESRHVSLRKGDDAQGLSARLEQHGHHHG